MSTLNIQFHDKIKKKIPKYVFLSYWKNFVGTEKRVRIIHGKQAIRVPAIEVILYFCGIIRKIFVWKLLLFKAMNFDQHQAKRYL